MRADQGLTEEEGSQGHHRAAVMITTVNTTALAARKRDRRGTRGQADPDHVAEPDDTQNLIDPAIGQAVARGQHAQVIGGGAAACRALASSRAPTSVSGTARSR
jgi:hypothetical protein